MPPAQRPPAGSTLLLVDDDDDIRSSYSAVLHGAGYTVIEARDGGQVVDIVRREKPALILLDVDMPRVNGWDALRNLHEERCEHPVVMLTGCVEIDDRVKGLSLGADDYLCKPCNHRELLARVHAVLRRSRPEPRGHNVLAFGDLAVNLTERSARRGTEPVKFTRTEYAMLELLSSQMGRLVTREQMLEQVWGYGAASNTRTVDTHIWRLRQKLQDDAHAPRWIQSVPAGGGYRLVAELVTADRSV